LVGDGDALDASAFRAGGIVGPEATMAETLFHRPRTDRPKWFLAAPPIRKAAPKGGFPAGSEPIRLVCT